MEGLPSSTAMNVIFADFDVCLSGGCVRWDRLLMSRVTSLFLRTNGGTGSGLRNWEAVRSHSGSRLETVLSQSLFQIITHTHKHAYTPIVPMYMIVIMGTDLPVLGCDRLRRSMTGRKRASGILSLRQASMLRYLKMCTLPLMQICRAQRRVGWDGGRPRGLEGVCVLSTCTMVEVECV